MWCLVLLHAVWRYAVLGFIRDYSCSSKQFIISGLHKGRGQVSKSKPFAHNGTWNKLQEDLLTPNITTTNIMYNTVFSKVIHNRLKKSSVYFASLEITELLEAN